MPATNHTAQADRIEPVNPVHMKSAPTTRWTTVNFGEAIQGVQTPLSWGVWNYGIEISGRRAFGVLGVLSDSEVALPEVTDRRLAGIFYGRVAGNVNFFRTAGARMPGSSADVLEQKLFGRVSDIPPWEDPAPRSRKVTIAAKLPVGIFTAIRAMPRLLEEQRRWWQENTIVRPPQTMEAAQRLVQDAANRFAEVVMWHTVASMPTPQILETLTALAEQGTGDAALGAVLATGFGGMEETNIITDLWRGARGELAVADIQQRHGFHGPNEGRLDTFSWREDPAPIEAIMRGYTVRGTTDPREREREQTARREAATARVLDGLPAVRRPAARLAMKLASIFVPAREIGKAAFLHDLDAARCGARVGGQILADRGRIADPEDVFFLTLEEFTAVTEDTFQARVAERRANHERYLTLELPPTWNGEPEPVAPAATERAIIESATRLTGIGVVGERVTGRARVISDPTTAVLEPGDILVCATTDPSWTPLFMLADALVIDTGGQISHGAIVARELGVCCVINTVTGTNVIPEGATITVDGTAGTVELTHEDTQSERREIWQ
jgi:phosphohistidine swiveling domain-containing protein